MPHYKLLKNSFTIICGKCDHKWNRKRMPITATCPKCKHKAKVKSKL